MVTVTEKKNEAQRLKVCFLMQLWLGTDDWGGFRTPDSQVMMCQGAWSRQSTVTQYTHNKSRKSPIIPHHFPHYNSVELKSGCDGLFSWRKTCHRVFSMYLDGDSQTHATNIQCQTASIKKTVFSGWEKTVNSFATLVMKSATVPHSLSIGCVVTHSARASLNQAGIFPPVATQDPPLSGIY